MTSTATDPELNERGVTGFGMELQLDLAGCDLTALDSQDELITFVTLLAERIGMTTYGDPLAVRFGEGNLAGWTVVQLITTSNINLHAVPANKTLFLNVFSCRRFNPPEATEFAVEFFRATNHKATVVDRTAPPA